MKRMIFAPAILSFLYILSGTISIWLSLMIVNATFWSARMQWLYDALTHPAMRMLAILPILGFGHMLFSLGMKLHPQTAAPAGIVLTVLAPILYALWLLQAAPSLRILFIIMALIVLAALLGMELEKLKN